MRNLKLYNVGQIVEADISFGDLTVFVGPQATGKSIALQFLKLMVDMGHVQAELAQHGVDWDGKLEPFLDVFFGEGMRSIWREGKSQIFWSNEQFDLRKRVARKQTSKSESLFYIPAQRVLALRNGWPRPFTDYSPGDPYVVREFSERLRLFLEKKGIAHNKPIFPQHGQLRKEFRDLLQAHVFAGFRLYIDKVQFQKRIVLGTNGAPLPFMVWSAGQREFVPLLLGLYWLRPPKLESTRAKPEWVVIEEPETGLHPRAISVVLLMIFDLLHRGYRVCISTHSPHILEAAWAIRHLKENRGTPVQLLTAFDVHKTQPMQQIAESILKKTVKVYYFEAQTGCTNDISDLDPSAEEEGDSGWGGLLEFSGRVNTVVADVVANFESGTRP